MGFFYLLADLMRNSLSFPYRIIQGLKTWRAQRLMLQRSTFSVDKEVQEVQGLKKFFKRLGRAFLYFLALIFLVGFVFLLIYLNDRFDLPKVLGGPWPGLRPYWLPLLFVFFGATAFLGFRLWKMLGPEKETGQYPEIDQALLETQAALLQAGINLRDAPLYLILGKPSSSLAAFFEASKIGWLVRQMPLRAEAPFQVYANPQGIFLAATHQSLLGRVAEQLAKGTPGDADVPMVRNSVFDDSHEAPAALPRPTPMATSEFRVPQNLLADSPAEDPNSPSNYALAESMPTLEERTARQSLSRWKPIPAKDVDDVRARWTYLTRFLAKQRRPYCPVNGVVMLVPLQALANAEETNQVAGAIESDIRQLRETAQIRCPSWIVVTDLETLPGSEAFLESLDGERRSRLLGQEFPLWPNLPTGDCSTMIENGSRSFSQALSTLVLKLLRIEGPNLTPNAAAAKNASLFRFLLAMRQSVDGLKSLLHRLLTQEFSEGMYCGGFYWAATGQEAQAFVPGLFRRLVDEQNKVSWTAEAFREEKDYQRWTLVGYGAMGVFCLLLVWLGYLRWNGVG